MSLLSIFKHLLSKEKVYFTPEYAKKWFITKDKDSDLFKEWITSEQPNLKAKYFYLAQTTSLCYKCTKPSVVYAIILPEGFESIDEEANERIEAQGNILNQPQFCTQKYLSILSYLTYISPKALDEIYKYTSCAFFTKKYSMTTNHSYYRSICKHCFTAQGDNYIISESNSAFHPTDIDDFKKIKFNKILVPIAVRAGKNSTGYEFNSLVRCSNIWKV